MNLRLPNSWQQVQQGERYCNAIGREFSHWAHKILGQQFVQIGGLSAELDAHMTLPYHFVISPETTPNLTALAQQKPFVLVQSDLNELPFESHSIDVCMAANSLNFTPDPHQLLREIHRILTDDGLLFLSLFNPCSPLLLKRNLSTNEQTQLPFKHYHSKRIADWLKLLNFTILERKNIGNRFMPPLTVIIAKKQTYRIISPAQESRFKLPSFGGQQVAEAFSVNKTSEIGYNQTDK